MKPKSGNYGCLVALVLMVALGIAFLWALSPRIRRLEKWFAAEKPVLLHLPTPPVGDETPRGHAQCLMVAEDSRAFQDEDVNFNIIGDEHDTIWYPQAWSGDPFVGNDVDFDKVDYIVFLRPGRMDFASDTEERITYSVDPLTGKKTEIGRTIGPSGVWVVHDKDVFILRRDSRECVLARNIKSGELAMLLSKLGLSCSQLGHGLKSLDNPHQ
jgi:hypothetical protein